jgi:hypothetical protein
MTHQQIQVTVEDLEEENARLTALLEANGIEWRKSVRSKEKLEGVRGQNRLSIEQKLSCSSAFFEVARIYSLCGGRAGQVVRLAIPQPAPMNGLPEFAKSPGSNVPTVETDNSYNFRTQCSMTTWLASTRLACIPCWLMRPAIFWRQDLEVVPRYRDRRIETVQDARIQEIFKLLTNDDARTDAIAAEIEAAYRAGRKVLVLTERTEHLTAIQKALADKDVEPFVLHGRMSKKQRSTFISPRFCLIPRICFAAVTQAISSPGPIVFS